MSADRQARERASLAAFWWAVGFTAMHVYWFAGGRVGFGDQADPLPGWPTSVGGWLFEVVVWTMFAAGLLVPIALIRSRGAGIPHRLLVSLAGAGAVVLLARGGSGLLDDVLRFGGLAQGGLTGLSDKEVLGSAHPSAYTELSTVGIDAIFMVGGLLFARVARLSGSGRSSADLTARPSGGAKA